MGGSRRKRIYTDLRCEKCGYEFEGWAMYMKPRTADHSTVRGWMVVEKAPRGLQCPRCRFVGAVLVVNPQLPD